MNKENEKRFLISVWHGEVGSAYYLIDTIGPDGEPDIIATYWKREAAEKMLKVANDCNDFYGGPKP